jgi:hypothetical protein
MGKRHQASRRKAYGRRQHELHERFDRGVSETDRVATRIYETDPYADGPDAIASLDLAATRPLLFASRD